MLVISSVPGALLPGKPREHRPGTEQGFLCLGYDAKGGAWVRDMMSLWLRPTGNTENEGHPEISRGESLSQEKLWEDTAGKVWGRATRLGKVWGRSCWENQLDVQRPGEQNSGLRGGLNGSVQLGKTPNGDFPLRLGAHGLLQLNSATPNEAEGRAHRP